MQPQMKLNPSDLLLQAKAKDLREHYSEALKGGYWPGVNGDHYTLLEYMDSLSAKSAIHAIHRDEVEALTLNPDLKFQWLNALDLIIRG
tara:strand:- start:58 stop:324 length:267 start_codon:yes stop_codon:yes gene_type:complete